MKVAAVRKASPWLKIVISICGKVQIVKCRAFVRLILRYFTTLIKYFYCYHHHHYYHFQKNDRDLLQVKDLCKRTTTKIINSLSGI